MSDVVAESVNVGGLDEVVVLPPLKNCLESVVNCFPSAEDHPVEEFEVAAEVCLFVPAETLPEPVEKYLLGYFPGRDLFRFIKDGKEDRKRAFQRNIFRRVERSGSEGGEPFELQVGQSFVQVKLQSGEG